MFNNNEGFVDDERKNNASSVALKSVIRIGGNGVKGSTTVGGPRSSSSLTWKPHPDKKALKLDSKTSIETTSSGVSSCVGSNDDDDEMEEDNSGDLDKGEGEVKQKHQCIAILGAGDFGIALAKRMVHAGYVVNIGSRDPQRNVEIITGFGANPRFHDEAIKSSEIVIVAIPKDYYKELPVHLLEGKVVVDCSNRNSTARKTALSQAEYLQSLAPNAIVVKAFNVLSAYALESGGLQGSKEVFLAGNDTYAKDVITNVIRNCGFTPVDMGCLRSSREIEDIPVQRFRSWKSPFVVSAVFFVLHYLLAFGKFQVCWTLTWGDGAWHWDRFNFLPMDTLNKVLSVHAITVLSICYLPGVIAAYIQIVRGTKYSRFPRWLDKWLKMRKQLGLLMLFSASLHACISVAIMSPGYQDLVFGAPTKILASVVREGGSNLTQRTIEEDVEVEVQGAKMGWRGELFLVCGVLSYAFAVILGITSLPSVTATMTWKEFAFVQSKLGWACLILACAHDLFYGWPYIDGPSCKIPSSFQYCLYLPGLTMALKIPLIFLSRYLDKIRGGWERGRSGNNSSSSRSKNLLDS